jgi:hypothetical protein
MMGSDANGKDFAHNPFEASLGLQASPDRLRPSRGVVDRPSPGCRLLCVLVKRHAAQVQLEVTGVLSKIVQ